MTIPKWMRMPSREESGGRRMRKLRLDSGISLRKMAERLGVTPSAVSAMERASAQRKPLGAEVIDRYMRILMAKKVCKNRDRLEVFWMLQVIPPEALIGIFGADLDSFIRRVRYAAR